MLRINKFKAWHIIHLNGYACTLLCFVLLWLDSGQFYPYSSRLLHWHWGNTIAPVPVKQPWRIWANAHHKSNSSIYNHDKTICIFHGIYCMVCLMVFVLYSTLNYLKLRVMCFMCSHFNIYLCSHSQWYYLSLLVYDNYVVSKAINNHKQSILSVVLLFHNVININYTLWSINWIHSYSSLC